MNRRLGTHKVLSLSLVGITINLGLFACNQSEDRGQTAQLLYRAIQTPCGETIAEASSRVNVAYTFTGYEQDSQLAMLDAGARFYNSSLCQFLSIDPVASPGSSYQYADGNFLNRVDLDGRKDTPANPLTMSAYAILLRGQTRKWSWNPEKWVDNPYTGERAKYAPPFIQEAFEIGYMIEDTRVLGLNALQWATSVYGGYQTLRWAKFQWNISRGRPTNSSVPRRTSTPVVISDPQTAIDAMPKLTVGEDEYRTALFGESYGGNAGPGRAAVNAYLNSNGEIIAFGNSQNIGGPIHELDAHQQITRITFIHNYNLKTGPDYMTAHAQIESVLDLEKLSAEAQQQILQEVQTFNQSQLVETIRFDEK